MWGENDALCRVGGIGPGLFDFGKWRKARVDVERSVCDFLGECGQFGEDFAGTDGALSAADDLKASGAERAAEIIAVSPATEPISIQMSGLPRSARPVTTATIVEVVSWPQR